MAEMITDARGRSLEVQKLSRREIMRLMRQWGAASNVEMWVGNALIAANARSIDGVPVPMPNTIDQAEALVDRLDDPGLTAVAEWLAAQRESSDLAAAKDAVKN